MRKFLFILLPAIATLLFSFSLTKDPEKMSTDEEKLFKEINSYRKSLKLPEIPYSPKLTRVAQIHAKDLSDHPPTEKCNMHSWSGKTEGSACCYTSDHKNPECMWQKPRELAGYEEAGYEIAAMNTDPEVDWLKQWKGSPGHHQVIINQGIWKTMKWNAMGVGIRGGYAVVWFGILEDRGKPVR